MSRDRSHAELWLVWLLRVIAGVETLAFLAVVMPTSWMAAAHERLGMGEFPASPLVEYLTRSLSALYGAFGLLQIFVSFDVRRYRPLVVFLAWAHVAFGLGIFMLDVWAELPGLWIWWEGPPIVLTGLVFLALLRGVPDLER